MVEEGAGYAFTAQRGSASRRAARATTMQTVDTGRESVKSAPFGWHCVLRSDGPRRVIWKWKVRDNLRNQDGLAADGAPAVGAELPKGARWRATLGTEFHGVRPSSLSANAGVPVLIRLGLLGVSTPGNTAIGPLSRNGPVCDTGSLKVAPFHLRVNIHADAQHNQL